MGAAQAVFSGNPAVNLTGVGYFTLDGQTRATLSSGEASGHITVFGMNAGLTF